MNLMNLLFLLPVALLVALAVFVIYNTDDGSTRWEPYIIDPSVTANGELTYSVRELGENGYVTVCRVTSVHEAERIISHLKGATK